MIPLRRTKALWGFLNREKNCKTITDADMLLAATDLLISMEITMFLLSSTVNGIPDRLVNDENEKASLKPWFIKIRHSSPAELSDGI